MPDFTAAPTNTTTSLETFPSKKHPLTNGTTPLELSVKRTSTGSSELNKLESPATSSWTSFAADNMDNASQIVLSKEDEDDDNGGLCQWGPLKPKCLQRFRTAGWVLFCLCWAGALQGMVVNGFVNVVITTIERRFDLRSTETGLIAGAYDIASFCFLIPVSYFGGIGRKSRWLGFGMLIMSVGSFVFTLPHFTTDLYTFDAEVENLCVTGNGTDRGDGSGLCGEGGKSPMGFYKHIFFLGQFLHGVGAAPLYTLGVAFVDESVSTRMSSVYLGTYYGMAIIGPAVGYLLGSQFLKIYTDVGYKDPAELGLNPSSNMWVGAWWIGFLISGLLAFLVALPILGFPKVLPGAKKIQAEKISEAHKGDDTDENEVGGAMGFRTSLKDLPRSLLILVKNPCFMFLSLAGACEAHLLNGFAAFLPKYIETQFSIAASLSSLLVGIVTVPAGGGGTFLGGYLVKHFSLRCSGIIKMCIMWTIGSLVLSFVFLMNCPQLPFAGINTPYLNSDLSVPNLNASCTAGCQCKQEKYDPICGIDNTLYYSPCFAGCQTMHQETDQKWYSNCSCISGEPKNVTLSDNSILATMATGNMCESDCKLLPGFLVVLFFVMLFTFLSSMPALSATLRCVPGNQRSFCLGIQWLIVRLLGSIPAPIVFGALMDSSCVLWHDSCHGDHGSCRVYDNMHMSRILLIVAIIGKGISLLSFISAWFVYKPPQSSPITRTITLPQRRLFSGKDAADISVISRDELDYSVKLINHNTLKNS